MLSRFRIKTKAADGPAALVFFCALRSPPSYASRRTILFGQAHFGGRLPCSILTRRMAQPRPLPEKTVFAANRPLQAAPHVHKPVPGK